MKLMKMINGFIFFRIEMSVFKGIQAINRFHIVAIFFVLYSLLCILLLSFGFFFWTKCNAVFTVLDQILHFFTEVFLLQLFSDDFNKTLLELQPLWELQIFRKR